MLARLSAIVGEANAGSPELLDTHRRDAFTMKPFDAVSQNPPQRHRDTEITTQKTQKTSVSPCLRGGVLSQAVRVLRPALPAQVTVRDNQPVRVACAGDGSRAPLAGDIAWASGPWRSSGDWWTETTAPH